MDDKDEKPKSFHYEWIPAGHGEGTSNVLIKVKVED